MEELLKIVVAHPNKQHSYQLATALRENGYLFKYITTVYDKQNSFTRVVKKVLSHTRYSEKINSKHCYALPDDQVKQFCEIGGILYLFVMRLGCFKHIYRQFGAIINKRFGKKVAKFAIKNHVDAVIMFDATADACFSYLKEKAPSIKCFLDMSSNATEDRIATFEEYSKLRNNDEIVKENSHLWNRKFRASCQREIRNADYFLCASHFTINSLLKTNVTADRCFLVPYGINLEFFRCGEKKEPSTPLKIVYTGTVSVSKGLLDLLDVVCKLDKEIDLTIMGGMELSDLQWGRYKRKVNVHYLGFVNREALVKIYAESDVFIFPSLGDGFGFSALEAMACGLPVVCSDKAGIADLIVEKKNGMTFSCENVDELKTILHMLCKNHLLVSQMSKEAVICTKTYTIPAYNGKIKAAIETILIQK